MIITAWPPDELRLACPLIPRLSDVSVLEREPAQRLALSLLRILKVLNEDVRAREDLGLMTVFPTHEVGRRTMVAEHLQDLAVTLVFPLVVSPDHQAITWVCVER